MVYCNVDRASCAYSAERAIVRDLPNESRLHALLDRVLTHVAPHDAAMAFINDHNVDWARTGHMAIRNSVLESDEYRNLPHRPEYAGTVDIARDTPPSENYGAIQDQLDH